MDKKVLLEWYIDTGVDEAIDNAPVNYFQLLAAERPAASITTSITHPAATITAPPAATTPLHHLPSAAIATARTLADKATTLAELEDAVRHFDGCGIKRTASKTVFSDGNPEADVMIIGEAPGAQEDRQGIPFCGPSGQLLDRMLAAIGLDRKSVYISNTVFWRPPGNRQPSTEEAAICLPLVEKHIALIAPKLLILSGGTATTTLLQKDTAISRLRGKFYEYNNQYLKNPVSTLLIYHPSYLLRQPLHKRLAWHDLQLAQQFLNAKN
jgi:uracil-DNA glycosylase